MGRGGATNEDLASSSPDSGFRPDALAFTAMGIAGVLWGIAYILAGAPHLAAWPWAFTLLAVITLEIYRRTSSAWALNLQLVACLLIPWLLMWDIGDFAASGAVTMWSLIAPIAALLTYGFRRSLWWFGAYVALVAIAAVREPVIASDDVLSQGWIRAFFVLNIVGVTATAWLVIGSFAKQREELIARANEARAEAEAATQAKSDFLANMSHEIRTPMNAIIGMGRLLSDTPLDQEQREYVGSISSSSELLLSVINDVLDLSKIQADKLVIDLHPVDLRDVVESALDIASPLAGAKHLDLVYGVEPAVPATVLTDGPRLRQVLVNLLSNAVKFTDEGQVSLVVALGTEPDTDAIRFEVADTGIGIAPETASRLFESFGQANASTSRRYGGTGLGLSISARLVAMLGGEIVVDSQLGRGSTFSFSIAAQALAPASDDTVDVEPLDGRRVMILEPNPTDQVLIGDLVREWGMQPAIFGDPAEAVGGLAGGARPDVALLCSASVAGDEGGQLFRRLSEARILTVALERTGDQESFADMQPDARVRKPIKRSALHDTLVDLLSEWPKRVPTRQQQLTTVLDPTLSSRAPLSILLAEDNPTNQRLAVKLLERMGYRPDVAANGAEAVAATRTTTYDLILMDVQMPEVDGLEATRRIRALPVAQPRIVALTANSSDSDRHDCLGAGMDDYLSKPLRPEMLVSALLAARESADPGVHHVADLGALDGRAVVEVNDPSTIDTAALERLAVLGGDPDFVTSLLTEFRQEAGEVLERIRAAPLDDRATIRLEAHSLKSSAATVGATALSERARELEAAAGDAASDDLGPLIDAVVREAESALQALRELHG